MSIKVKVVLILILLIVISLIAGSYLLSQSYIVPKGCFNCPPHPIKEKIELSFYYERGDSECIKVRKLLEILSLSLGNISIQMRDIALPNNKELFDMLIQIYHRGSYQRKKIPAIFLENKVIIGYENIYNEFYLPVIREIERETSKGIREKFLSILRRIKIYLINSSESLLSITVLVAGLIDGINPCAISILVFFIFSLSKMRNTKMQILVFGISFILGVFISYLLIGLGLLKLVINSLFVSIYNWIFISMGILAFVISGLSILDLYYIKRGETKKIKLQLPLRYKKVSHSIIRNISIPSLLMVFWVGILMSFIEFPCSGQVYLPTLTLIGNPLNSFKPFLLLLLYNFMFTLPLIIIITVSTLWLSSEKVSKFVSKNLALNKLLTAILFFLIGMYMVMFL